MATTVLEQTRGTVQVDTCFCDAQQQQVREPASYRAPVDLVSCLAAGHEEAEHLERLIVKDFRNELKGHKERLQQSHRVRNMLDVMQERAKKLVRQFNM